MISLKIFITHTVIVFCLQCYCILAKPQPVFIAISNSKGVKHVTSATDAAMALNSLHFMEMFVGVKNSAEIKTYTQYAQQLSLEPDLPIEDDTSENTILSWTAKLIPGIFKRRKNAVQEEDANVTKKSLLQCPQSQFKSSPCPKHETVAEYVGQLWFLNKNGIRFRETIKIVAISSDGRSSTVECNTEYHNGSKWIRCSRIICELTSHAHDGDRSLQHHKEALRVEMTLDCELFVWLPLPHAAKQGVMNKISSVFESVALEFFDAN